MKTSCRESLNRRRTVDLRDHHARCEMNFHQFISLLPGLRNGVDAWAFDAGEHKMRVEVRVLDAAPYTTTLTIEQYHANSAVHWPRLAVRLYHDVGMAEIVSWDHHRQWQFRYDYPNANMYHPNDIN